MTTLYSWHPASDGADGAAEPGAREFGWRAALADNERISREVGTHDGSIRDTLASVGATKAVTQRVTNGGGRAARIVNGALPWVLAGLTLWALACLATGGQPQLLLQHLRW